MTGQASAGPALPGFSREVVERGEAESDFNGRAGASSAPTRDRFGPATSEQRERILLDPLVQQTLELFQGTIINMERELSVAPEATEDDME